MLRKILTILLLLVLTLFLVQVGLYVYHEYIQPPYPVGKSKTQTGKVELPTIRQSSPIGINTNEVHYEDASLPFVDLFRAASPFSENLFRLQAEEVTYDENGWPTRIGSGEVGTKFLGMIPPEALPKGEYTVLYEGEGKLRYGHDVKVVYQSPGRDVITFDPRDDGLVDASVVITQTNPANYLRNIHILPPGGICRNNPLKRVMEAAECGAESGEFLSFLDYYDSIVFNPDYLNFMKDFKAIRFMPMSGITRNPVEHWKDRQRPEKAGWGGTYGNRGAPVEIMVELANRLHKDAWFNMPHAADDEYMREFASYVRDHLDPELKIYLEYTNEVWNTTFTHSEYTQKKGIEMGLSINAVEAGFEYYTIRARQMFEIWEQVFNGRERFVRVLGGWDTRLDVNRKLLNYNDTYQHIDALAIAPYFGGNLKGYRESETVDDIFRLTSEEDSYRSLPEVLAMVKQQARLADQYGVDLLAYEGGQGLVDWATRKPEQHPNPLFFEANRDPHMGELYTEFLDGWDQAGGKLMMLFSAPRICRAFGCWGLKEYINQPREEAPKYDAVLTYIAEHKAQAQEPVVIGADAGGDGLMYQAKERGPDDPVIVWRPMSDPERAFFLENPRTLDVLLESDDWAKKDLFGKWQGKWDEDTLFLSVRVYDQKIVQDSDDPVDDDSVEFFIDSNNSRGAQLDGKHDFHLVFNCERVTLGKDSAPIAPELLASISTSSRAVYDGYYLEAWIPWKVFGMKPKVTDRVSVDVQINDDDDGGARDKKISWMAKDENVATEPKQWGVILFSGR